MRSDTQLWTRHEMDMGEGMPEEVFHMPATPEEIKEAHGKCGTCKHIVPVKFLDENGIGVDYECNHEAHSNRDPIAKDLSTDYCNHHEPKEE